MGSPRCPKESTERMIPPIDQSLNHGLGEAELNEFAPTRMVPLHLKADSLFGF